MHAISVVQLSKLCSFQREGVGSKYEMINVPFRNDRMVLRRPLICRFFVFFMHSTKIQSIFTTRGFKKAHLSWAKSGIGPIRCFLFGKTVSESAKKMGYG